MQPNFKNTMIEQYRFTIEDVDHANKATEWCVNNTKDKWDIFPHWPAAGYTYIFHSLDDAARFVVHWVH